MSGSTSSGRAPNCEIDVMGHVRTHAPQQIAPAATLKVARSNATSGREEARCVAESTSWRSHSRHPRLRLRTYASEPVAVMAPKVAEIPEGIGPPRPGSGMGGLAEAVFVIAIEPAMRVSAVSNLVKALKHR